MLLIDRPVKFVLTGQLRGVIVRVCMSILLIPVMFFKVIIWLMHIPLLVVVLLFMQRCTRRPYELLMMSVLVREVARRIRLLLLLSTLILKLL